MIISLSNLISNALQLTSTHSPKWHYLSSRASRYTRGKCQDYGTKYMGCIFVSVSSKQQHFSGILVTLLRFLTQMEKMWKDQLFSKYCQKNIFKEFCLNRNSNHFPESGLEPKLKRSAQISGFSLILSDTHIQVHLSKQLIRTCVEVWVYTQWVWHWGIVNGFYFCTCKWYIVSLKHLSSSAMWKCYIYGTNGIRYYQHKFGIVNLFLNRLGNIRF